MQPRRRHQNELTLDPTRDSAEGDLPLAGATRRCLASGEILPKLALLRFVVGPSDVLVFDAEDRLPGVGHWVQADRALLERACRRALFSKAARRAVVIPEGLVDQVILRLRRKCLNTIGLARRAGACVMGHEKTSQALRAGDVAILMIAADGSEGEAARVRAKAPDVGIIDDFSAEELGAASGRAHTVYGAIRRGRLADELLRDVTRLRGVDSAAGKTDCRLTSVSTNAHTDS